ncbi:MAG: hypothetical protein L0387_07125, partial [Acidobacteria bacterium]|nr:hypothetical protein [Acidobacteriota bacterium]
HLALLLPFAFQRVLLARLLPAGLRRARYYVGSDASPPPDFRWLRSATLGVRVQAGSVPGTVGSWLWVAAPREWGHRFATPGRFGTGR